MESAQPVQSPSEPTIFDRVKNKWQRWKRLKILAIKDEETEEEKVLGSNWDQVGFHRPISGTFYAIGFLPFEAVFGILLLPLAQLTSLRFPEIGSFEAIAGGLFGAVYSIMDFELGNAIDRFVPEYLIKDPRKATQFATFFIKYQMLTGLFQVTFLSWIILTMLQGTNMAYLMFFLLFINVKQYPGQLGVFDSILKSYQALDKEYLRGFLQISIIQNVTGPVFGIIGLFYGMANPVLGELMGLSLGYAIGRYVDDFVGFTIGAYFYSKILNKHFPGMRIRDIFLQKVDRDVWTIALRYSLKLMPNTIFSSLVGFFGWSIRVNYIPGYVTWSGLIKTGEDITKFAGWGREVLGKSQAGMSEAYNNGQNTMLKYYIASSWKYNMFLFVAFFSILAIGIPAVLDGVIAAGFLSKQWVGVTVVIPWLLMRQTWGFLDDTLSKCVFITNHPEVNTTLNIISTLIDFFFTWYFFVVLNLGWFGLIITGVPSQVMRMVIRYIWVHRNMIKFDKAFWKGIAWQVFMAPLLAGACYWIFIWIAAYGVYPVLRATLGDGMIVLTTMLIVVFVLLTAFVIYFPLYAFFGGFDEYSLNVFKKAVALTGPSIILTWPFYKLFAFGYRHSPFKKQAVIAFSEDADREVLELARLRLEGRAKAAKEAG